MAKPRPVDTGDTTMPEIDLVADAARNAERAEREAVRNAELAEQETANYARSHGDPVPDPAPAEGATDTTTPGE